jgi:hypothetical protein
MPRLTSLTIRIAFGDDKEVPHALPHDFPQIEAVRNLY